MLPDTAVVTRLFAWAPEWYLKPLDLDAVTAYSPSAWIATLTAYLLLNGLAAPIVEELYFRGWLLPRMTRFGRWAPVLSTVLFSLYHVWTPWQFFSRVAAVAPYTYAVSWRRNVYLGMVVHILLNTVGGLLVIGGVASRI